MLLGADVIQGLRAARLDLRSIGVEAGQNSAFAGFDTGTIHIDVRIALVGDIGKSRNKTLELGGRVVESELALAGKLVAISGIESKPELNGQMAEVVLERKAAREGRTSVRLRSTGEMLSLKTACLQVIFAILNWLKLRTGSWMLLFWPAIFIRVGAVSSRAICRCLRFHTQSGAVACDFTRNLPFLGISF